MVFPELGIFAVVNHSSVVQISSDGLTWITYSCPQGNWNSIVWSPEDSLFIACGSGGLNFMRSNDGKTWISEASKMPIKPSYCLSGSHISTQPSPTSICYGEGFDKKYVAVTGTNTYFYSEDGISWTSSSSSENLNGSFICCSPELGLYCAVGNQIPYCSIFDGTNWVSSSISEPLNAVCWVSDMKLFVAVGLDSIFISSDGITWTEQKSPNYSYWTNVCYSPELHVIVIVTGSTINCKIGYSFNAIDWFVTDPPEQNNWRGLCWSRELGIFISTSIDGEHKAMTSKYVKRCF